MTSPVKRRCLSGAMPVVDTFIPSAENLLDCIGAMCPGVTLSTTSVPPETSTASPTRAGGARDLFGATSPEPA